MDQQRRQAFRQVLESAGERAALEYLSTLSTYRYLSVIYYAEGRGHPVHFFDRDNPDQIEAEEIDQQASYCSIVLRDRAPFHTADSLADERVTDHPARAHVRAYFGLPLLAADGSAHAVLCHYDHFPRSTLELDQDLLRYAATEFERRLARYGNERAAPTAETAYTETIGTSTFHVLKHTKAEWLKPRFSLERQRRRADGTLTPRITYGQSFAVGQGGFSSLQDAQDFGREWCLAG